MLLTDASDSSDISWGIGHPGLHHSLNSLGFMGQDLPGMDPTLGTRNSVPIRTSVLPSWPAFWLTPKQNLYRAEAPF